MLDEDKRNHKWKRPADWPYDEDWGSKVWKERMKVLNERIKIEGKSILSEDKINLDWNRPDDWLWEEDYDSKVWKNKMKVLNEKLRISRMEFGFTRCPGCNSDHTGFTLVCRNCGYKADQKTKMPKVDT